MDTATDLLRFLTRAFFCCVFVGGYALQSAIVSAAEANARDAQGVNPYMELRAIYTDNVFLSETSPESDVVTEITPGFTWNRVTPRLRFNMDISSQILAYQNAENSEGDSVIVNPKADIDATLTAVPNWFYLDAGARYDQRVTNAVQYYSFDNINIADDRSNYGSYRVSPYLRHRTGSGVYSYLRVSAERLDFESEGPVVDRLSDSDIFRAELNFNNDLQRTRVNWSLSANQYVVERDTATFSKTEFSTASATLGYSLSRRISVIGKAGYSENFIDGVERGVNGSYSSGGLRWTPNNRFSLQAVAGDMFSELSLRWSPSRRTELNLSARESDIGVDRGTSGEARFQWQGKRSRMYGAYSEGTTNEQLLIQDGETLVPLVDQQGNPFVDPSTGLPVSIAIPNFALADDEFLRKRGEIGFEYSGRNFNQNVVVYHEDRTYFIRTNLDGDAVGMRLTFSIPVAKGWRAEIQGSYSETMYFENDQEETREYIRMGGTQSLGARSSWGIYVQQSNRESERDGKNYEEHRAFVEWHYRP